MKTFEEVYETLPTTGWLSLEEARLLYKCCAETNGNILEVGCYHGRSTVLLASFGRIVYAVDPFNGFDSDDMEGVKTQIRFNQNLDERGIENVNVIPYGIEEVPTESLEDIGLAYLDGDHTYKGTRNQINAALEARAKVIAIHDVNDSGDGVEIKRAALELLGPWYERVERLAVWKIK